MKKVLIANRGEIAVRIIRACRDMGISPVVVYSTADRESLAVKLADEAVWVGEPPAAESYLAIDRIVEAARACGARGIHPGYGFLAENEDFVAACEAAGLIFIGPSADSISKMGDKIASRETVLAAGVPVVPGSDGAVASAEAAVEAARRIGYPLMLKASAGGGGKWMRLVREESELRSVYAATSGEAKSSFGDATVFLEKYIERPRHIEVQVLGDRHGNLVHLCERECSIQRRHQKVVEECPSPIVKEAFRRKLGEAALAAAKSVGYYNAGTVEFLVDGSVESDEPPFYFLEMNTRLQVEHPITEMVVGIDLVREQIRVARGERLKIRQEEVRPNGAAIECRIYAEDPLNNFFPSPGKITSLFEPSGPGVRNDSGVYAGFEIPIHYDPMISKLVTHGRDRAEAVARMRRALREYKVAGVRTTIPFFETLLRDPEFLAGRLHTHFIQEQGLIERIKALDQDLPDAVVAAAALQFLLDRPAPPAAAESRRSAWKESGRFSRRFTR